MKTQEDIDFADSRRQAINAHIAEVEAVMDEEGLEVYYLWRHSEKQREKSDE